jgi:pimeloyl-ACP methyl ester carboxylesterase
MNRRWTQMNADGRGDGRGDGIGVFYREWTRRDANGRGGMRWVWVSVLFSLMALAVPVKAEKPVVPGEKLPERVVAFTVYKRSAGNEKIPFYLRVPKNYQPGKFYRMLFLCPHLNQEGLAKLAGSAQWLTLADERDWFVMTCTFKQGLNDGHDRKLSYYYPETYSGKAMLDALEKVASKYPVDTERLLMQGLSGGAQFVHRFALWTPDRVTAVAVNSSSWFDAPNDKCNRVAWLITIGESDDSYNQSLDMVDRLRNTGAAPLFRSYMGMVHEGSEAVDRLDMEFLKFHDERTRKDLGKRHTALTTPEELLSMKAGEMPYVGDSQDWKFWRNTPEAREGIAEDSRIYLPSEDIAKLWGQKEEPQ